jgi:hypothetical protein
MVLKRRLGETPADAPARGRRGGSLRIVDFLGLVDEGVRSRLSRKAATRPTNRTQSKSRTSGGAEALRVLAPVPEYSGWETRQRFGYVQYWRDEHGRGNPCLHYEVWVQRKTKRLEIGLHFEGDREWSYACAALLAEHATEVAAAIGTEWELEEWTASWTRLHRAFAAPVLSAELADEAAERVVGLMRGMEPLLEGLGVRG